jgi:hypothetical protein
MVGDHPRRIRGAHFQAERPLARPADDHIKSGTAWAGTDALDRYAKGGGQSGNKTPKPNFPLA